MPIRLKHTDRIVSHRPNISSTSANWSPEGKGGGEVEMRDYYDYVKLGSVGDGTLERTATADVGYTLEGAHGVSITLFIELIDNSYWEVGIEDLLGEGRNDLKIEKLIYITLCELNILDFSRSSDSGGRDDGMAVYARKLE